MLNLRRITIPEESYATEISADIYCGDILFDSDNRKYTVFKYDVYHKTSPADSPNWWIVVDENKIEYGIGYMNSGKFREPLRICSQSEALDIGDLILVDYPKKIKFVSMISKRKLR